jgi:F-type H+-transporting ATPase subunit gamma
MAKARAIVKRRKAVRNIRKITKTMQMIATAKFQKSLKRAVGTKPYTRKVRELVAELAASLGEGVEHPLLRQPNETTRTNKIALVVLTSNRGLAGAYNGSVLRSTQAFIRQQEAAGKSIDLYVSGKKGVTFFNYQRRPITQRYDQFGDLPRFTDVDRVANHFMDAFTSGTYDAVYVSYTNFVSAGVQKPDVTMLLPLAAPKAADQAAGAFKTQAHYDFFPSAREILDELLPQTVKSALFQAFLDATTSENVARMVAMKSATDNADKMVKSLTMRYNRARQSQITTELSEIMGGVEAMKG